MYKIAYLVRGKKIPITRILAVTFTNKAANEMKERLVKISEEIPANTQQNHQEKTQDKDSIDDFLQHIETTTTSTSHKLSESSLKRIGTFHSIFLKILKEDIEKLDTLPTGRQVKYTKNFGIFDTNESQSVIKEALKKLNLQEVFKVNEVK